MTRFTAHVKDKYSKRSFSLREVIAWSMIDFSNSLALVVVLALYAAFIPSYVYEVKADGTAALKYNSIATGVFSIITSPIIGAVVDISHFKIGLLTISGLIFSLSTVALTWVGYDDKVYAIVFYALVDITFRINESVCSSFLPTICNEKDFGFVSGAGYFIGYIAGFLVMQIVNRMTPSSAAYPDAGWEDTFYERGTAMLVTGIFMILGLLPSLLILREPQREKAGRLTCGVIGQAFRRNAHTFKKAFTDNRRLTMILVAYLLFMMGMYCQRAYNAFMHVFWGRSYGVTLNLVQLVMSVINIVVGTMSLLYGYISRFVGLKPMILISIFFVALCSAFSIFWEPLGAAFGVDNAGKFWVWTAGMFAALGIGPAQALLRAAVGNVIEPGKSCEIFSVMESLNTLADIFGNVAPEAWTTVNYRYVYGLSLPFLVAAFVLICIIPLRREDAGTEREAAHVASAEVSGTVSATPSSSSYD